MVDNDHVLPISAAKDVNARVCFRNIMVMMESVVSGHTFNTIRERLAEKLELIRFDPFSE